eukprot:scaffold20276_cov224-Skeletonema_marinoi.AAC.19
MLAWGREALLVPSPTAAFSFERRSASLENRESSDPNSVFFHGAIREIPTTLVIWHWVIKLVLVVITKWWWLSGGAAEANRKQKLSPTYLSSCHNNS